MKAKNTKTRTPNRKPAAAKPAAPPACFPSRGAVKLTPEVVRKVAGLQKRGVSLDDIARKLGLSKGTIAKASKMVPAIPAAKRLRAPAAAPSPAPAAPMDDAELGAWLAGAVRAQKLAFDSAMAKGDDVAAQKAAKLSLGLVALLSRHQVRITDDGGAVRVRKGEVDAAAARARSKLLDLATRIINDRAALPKCPACGNPIGGRL